MTSTYSALQSASEPHWRVTDSKTMEALGRFELPTCGLGNRRSIHLSYRANACSLFLNVLGVLRLRSGFRQRARTPANRLNLGNRRSIHLSYRANACSLFLNVLGVLRLRSGFRQRARTPANRLNLGNRRSIHLSYRANACSLFLN